MLGAALDRQGNLILVTQSTNAARPQVVSTLNPAGHLLWTRGAEPWRDGANAVGSSLAGSVMLSTDETGAILVGATVHQSAANSTYPAAAKISPQGDLIWVQSHQKLRSPGAISSRLVGLTAALDGKLAMLIEEVVPRVLQPWPDAMEVTGLVTTYLSPAGTPEWTRFFGSSEGHCNGGALAIDREGNVLVGGTLNVPRFSDPPGFLPITNARLLLLCYSADGVLRWGQPTGPQLGSLQVCNVAIGHAGDSYVLGTSLAKNSFSFQVYAYTSAGDLR